MCPTGITRQIYMWSAYIAFQNWPIRLYSDNTLYYIIIILKLIYFGQFQSSFEFKYVVVSVTVRLYQVKFVNTDLNSSPRRGKRQRYIPTRPLLIFDYTKIYLLLSILLGFWWLDHHHSCDKRYSTSGLLNLGNFLVGISHLPLNISTLTFNCKAKLNETQ